ncbi:MAG: YdjY domain-containing protein [Phycisphaerae bacterium]
MFGVTTAIWRAMEATPSHQRIAFWHPFRSQLPMKTGPPRPRARVTADVPVGGPSRCGRRWGIGLIAACLSASVQGSLAGQPPPQSDASTRPSPSTKRVRHFAPGVTIDWKNGWVEVEAVVVLRKGPLELLACSPKTREHESILAVNGRPMHIFQALGLIGLTPGAPPRYDQATDRMLPATGDPLDLRIRYQHEGRTRTDRAERWLRDIKRQRRSDAIPWVFSGSRSGSGRFAADAEGTVACVVDFETALISVGAVHSADNDALWLEANTDAIPPIGTACTLLIRAAPKPEAKMPAKIDVYLQPDGTLRRDGKPITPEQLARWIDKQPSQTGRQHVVLHVGVKAPFAVIDGTLRALVRAVGPRAVLEINRDPVPPSDP